MQAVADNFDTTISSPNGKKQTHSLALLMIQPASKQDKTAEEQSTFIRLKKSDIKDTLIRDVPLAHYSGPKKPSMTAGEVVSKPNSLKLLAHQVIVPARSRQKDFEFF